MLLDSRFRGNGKDKEEIASSLALLAMTNTIPLTPFIKGGLSA